MMIGVKKLVNPALQLAGDCLGRADIERGGIPGPRVSREQVPGDHARAGRTSTRPASPRASSRNLMLFGCWWFMNNPSMIDEITARCAWSFWA